MPRSMRSFLLPFLMLALPLGALAAVGAMVAHRQLSETRELAATRTLDAVRALVADFQAALRREALLLSRDPGVVEGATRGDWATLARGASPRVLSLTRDGVAEFIVVRDSRGVPLVQVPALPPTSAPGLLAGNEPMVEVKVIAERAYFLATAPVVTGTLADILQDGGSKVVVGTVVVGRRLEGLASLLDGLPSRPALLFLSDDRVLGSTRPAIPASGWTRAAAAGGVDLDGEPFRLRRLEGAEAGAADAALWVLLPDAEFAHAERRLRLELAALLAAGLLVIAGGVLLVGQGRRGGRPDRAPARREPAARDRRTALERRQREIEAVSAIAAAIGRGADLATTAGEMLDAVCRMVSMDVGAVYRLDPEGGRLVLVAQRGLSAEEAESVRVHPVDGSRVGEAMRSGRIEVTPPDAAPPLEPGLQDLVLQRAHRTQLALPVAVGGRPWGAMALESREVREFPAEELAALEAVAQQVGLAVGRVELQEMAAARLSRLEAQRLIERHISEQLDVEELLVMIAESALRLIGGAFSVLYLREEEVLRARAWCDVGDWIRDIPIPLGSGAMGAALERGRGVLVNDYPSSPFALPAFSAAVGRILVQPLLAGGRALGAMTICRDAQASPFTEDDLSTLADFAAKAAVALEHARLFTAASRSAAQYQALFEVGGLMGSTLEVQGVLDVIVERCCALLAVPGAGIFRLEPGTGHLIYERGRGLSPEFVTALRVRPGEGTTGRAVQERQPAWSTDVLADAGITLSDETRALVQREGYRAVLSVPLLSKGEAHGALAVYWWEPHTPTSAEISLLNALAGQAAVALENARLYEAATARGKRLSTLARLTETLTATLTLEEVLSRVVHSAVELFGSSFSTLWLADEGGETFSLRAHAGSRSPMAGVAPFRPGEGPVGRIVAARSPLVIADLREDPRVRSAESTPAEGGISFAGVPLLLGERVLGALSITLREPRGFSDEDLSLLESLANHAAIAIENARLYAEAQERLRETTTLLAVGRALSQPGPPEEMMRLVARETACAFGADMVGVYVLDERREALVPLAGYHVPKHLVELFVTRKFALARFPALEQVWRAGRAVWSSDVTHDPRFDQQTFEGIRAHSVLFAPTPVRGEPVGALFLVWWRTGREFDLAEIRLIEGVAAQMGLAMENTELGRRTQRKLQETETLLSVSQTLSSTLDMEMLPRQFLRHVVQALGADTAGIWLLSEDGEWMVPFVGYHVPPDRLEMLRRLRLSIVRHPFYAEAARTRQSVVCHDVMNDPRMPDEVRRAVPARTHLFVPIIAKDRMVGGFAAGWWERRRELSDAELRLMEAVASQAGVALENARLFRDNQRRVEELSVLHELSRAVTGQLDQAGLIETLHQQVARVLDVRHMIVLLLDETGDCLRVALRVRDGVRRDEEPRAYPRRAAGLSGVVLATGQAIRTEDYLGECMRRGVESIPESASLPHWLGVPMAAGNQVLGVLALRGRDRAFSEIDERLLTNIAQLAALALRSARLYEERTRAFGELAAAQDQLVRTEKLRALGEMASGVAHDFNNVLASILGRAQLLRDRVQDPKHRQWLEVIERSALDGARTVRRLQDFTRIRRDQPVVAVDLNQIIHQVLETTESTWRQETRRRGIEIEVVTALAPRLPRVAGDPAELREALTNLVLNAVDAMPEGGTLTLATSTRDGRVEATVTDTGVGIPEAIRQKIFDPFFTTKGPKGTGLGLSMTYGILSRHGARITAESGGERGTTFRLTFPAADRVGEPASPPAASPRASVPMRCLVVDDEEVVAEVVADMLTTAGHSAVVVGSGQQAVARFGTEPFDLVFTDLAMPGMTGWEVARAVKDADPAVPVVIVSGFGVEVSPEDLRAHGVDMVLSKPLRIQDVLGAVASVRSGTGDAQRGGKQG